MSDKNKPKLVFHGNLPPAAIDAVAELLLLTNEPECELCNDGPQVRFIEFGNLQGRHCCTGCFESLTDQPDNSNGEPE